MDESVACRSEGDMPQMQFSQTDVRRKRGKGRLVRLPPRNKLPLCKNLLTKSAQRLVQLPGHHAHALRRRHGPFPDTLKLAQED